MRRVLGTAMLVLGLLVGADLALAAVAAANEPTMKAVRIHLFGESDVLKYEDVARPVPGPGEILVQVHAASVNPVDWKIRRGMLKQMNLPMPFILGFDIAGIVDEAGPGATKFKVGDQVYAYLPLRRGGGYAEYVTVAESDLAKKPAKLDFEHAAAVPLAALTAWQALMDTAKVRAGQTVLIHAGAGGVGHFAIQIAKSRGARVIATASAANQKFLTELGADQTIDYASQKFEDVAKDVDVVLDSIGGDTLERSYGVVKSGGIIVSIVQPPDQARCKEHGIRGEVMLVKPDAAELKEIASLIDGAKIRPVVSEIFPLDQAAKAHELNQLGHTRGKIVLKVQ